LDRDKTDNPGVIALPPLIYAAGVIIGIVLHFIHPISFLPNYLNPWLGIVLIVISILIVLPAVRSFTNAKTEFHVRKPSTALVKTGLYKYSRNPMYISLTLLYFGITFLINSLWLLILVIPVLIIMQKGVIEREESYLEKKFGDDYIEYRKRVRRWI